MLEQFFVEGLKAAVIKGESLKSAMNSFVNAGYNPTEVAEAAKIVQNQKISPQFKPASNVIPIQKLSEQTLFKKPLQRNSIQTQNPSTQNYTPSGQVNNSIKKSNQLSSYGQKPGPPKRLLIIFIIICLIILIGSIIWLLLF